MQAPSLTTTLLASDVSVRFHDILALDNVSLQIEAGQRIALLGHNGAGKSTFFKAVLGFVPITKGCISILGHAPNSKIPRRKISYLPETVAFPHMLSAMDVMHYFIRLRGQSLKLAHPLLERVGIADAAHRMVGTYSKGMRQRLGLAQALIGNPDLLLLDEPTSGLDPVSRYDFYQILHDISQQGTSVLHSSHGLEEIESRTDQVVILSKGRLVAQGSLAKLAQTAKLDATLTLIPKQGCATALAQKTAHVITEDGNIEIHAPTEEKMRLLDIFAKYADLVEDGDLRMPRLEDVYRYYSTQSLTHKDHS